MSRCRAPWRALLIKPHGGVFPDPQFQGGYGSLRRDDLDTIWNGPVARATRETFAAGSVPDACRQCAAKEARTGHSRRLFFESRIGEPSFDVDARPDIEFLEITSSNLCNLKCVMCNGDVSSAWIKDEKAIAALDRPYERVLYQNRFVQIETAWLDNLFKNPDNFRNLRYLDLKGGEPFLEPKNADILRFFIDRGLAPSINLEMTTNGTIYDEEMLRLAERFRTFKLSISVEATGDLYGFIRGGKTFTFCDLEANLARFRQHDADIVIVTLTMAYNLWNLRDLHAWTTATGLPTTFSNVVVNPRYLDPLLIPLPARIAALEGVGGSDDLDRMLARLRTTTIPEDERRGLAHQFSAFTRDLETLRGQRIADIVPEIADLLERE